jgi:predicted dehydrogenase
MSAAGPLAVDTEGAAPFGGWRAKRAAGGDIRAVATPLRLAIAGFGAFGQQHAATARANPECTLVAIADPAPDAPARAAAIGVAAYADPVAMLDAVAPEALIVATPNAEHVPVALAAVERGIAVFVEKPIAESLDRARVLVEASAARDVPVLVGHHRRYNPVIAAARAAAASGALGRIVAVHAFFVIRKPDEYFDVRWRREPGGGPLLINAIHDIDNLRYIVGEIDEVEAMTASTARQLAVEDTAAALLRFAGGALGTLVVSDASPAPWSWELTSGEAARYPQRPGDCYFIAGTAGSLALPSSTAWHYAGVPSWTEPLASTRRDVTPADPQVRQLAHFLRVARRIERPRIDAADAFRTLAVTAAIAESATRRAPVKVART